MTPLAHDQIVKPRNPEYCYEAVRSLFETQNRSIDESLVHHREMQASDLFRSIPAQQGDPLRPHLANGFFSGADAVALMAMLKRFRPSRYLEIGSGNSTKFARHTVRELGIDTKITSIDPEPRAECDVLADTIIRESVLNVPPSIVDVLDAGDVLFHDGSHITFNGTDTVVLFLELLPRLRSGVLVHIHDIHLPFEYASSFDNRGYSEQYMLAAALLNGDQWEIIQPNHWLARLGRLNQFGGSFWMIKR